MSDIQALAEAWSNNISRQRDNLVAAAVLHYGVTDPCELMVCNQVTFNGGAKVWVELQSTKLKQDRLTALNEENAALRARVKELEETGDIIRRTLAGS